MPTLTSPSSPLLVEWAKQAIHDAELDFQDKPKVVDPNSNNSTANQLSIDIAKKFLFHASPAFLTSKYAKDLDRLVKVGRSVVNMIDIIGEGADNKELIVGLDHIVQQCSILASNQSLHVPKIRFGKTNIQMPIITLGCMRFQQTWNSRKYSDMSGIDQAQQDNLINILEHSIVNLGMNHIETARAYGSSELQLGNALQHLFKNNIVKREDLIIQTKVNAMDPKSFRDTLEKSFEYLQVEYFDLFSFHGLNMEFGYDLVFDNVSKNGGDENLIDIVREYQAKGKIRHVGFSSHSQPEFILKCINTGAFEYANIHYHYFGSYTASGGGSLGGNLENIRRMNELDMGVFIISPYDKGGRLYAPSRKLRSLTLPDLEPMLFQSLWMFNHAEMDSDYSSSTNFSSHVHTQTIGAARPSDLDEPAIAAYLQHHHKDEVLSKVKVVSKRLYDAQIEALGEEWVKTWHIGVPNAGRTFTDIYMFGQMVWLHNIIKAWGLLDYARDRYGTFDGNSKRFDRDKSNSENVESMKIGWGYMPGVTIEEGKDYSQYFENVPEKNKAKVLEAIQFAFKYCSKFNPHRDSLDIPKEWKTAYDARSWVAYPER